MVDYYVEPAGNDANLGTAPGAGNAWLTVEHALEAGALTAGDNVWVRRTTNETPVSDIACAYDGAADNPISIIGWPRAEEGAGSGVWANGSTEINDVTGLEMDREKHCGRRVKQDTDAEWYLITYVPYIRGTGIAFVDSNPDTITDTGNNFLNYGFKVGDKIRVTGSGAGNDGTYTVDGVAAGTLTLVIGDTVNVEAAGADIKIQVYDRFIIDREYQGTDTGAFTIQKDDDYDTRTAAGIAAGWDADADDLPVIDFNDGDFDLRGENDLYYVFKNLEFKDSLDASGLVLIAYCRAWSFVGCLIKQSVQNTVLLQPYRTCFYGERLIIEGSGAGAAQKGVSCDGNGIKLKDCAIYNCGDYGFAGYATNPLFENVNIGVEIANGDDDIYADRNGVIHGRDVKLGGTNGYVTFGGDTIHSIVQFENYDKSLGSHKTWFMGGSWQKVTAGSGAPVPNQRSGGSTHLIEITPDVANFEFIEDWAVPVFTHEFEVDTTTRTWRYYVQTNIVGGLTATDLWIKVEYIKKYDDASEYVIETIKSDEAVAARADIDDWTQYIEVPSVTPATASKVRIKLYVSKHDAANKIYIDPKVSNP